MRADRLDHATVHTALRAPRTVIVFPAESADWRYWARVAMYSAGSVWGGHGFVLAPEFEGRVNNSVLTAIAAYDPDYVVSLQPTMGQLDKVQPGYIDKQLTTLDFPESARDRLRADLARHTISFETAESARKQVTNVCSSYRMWFDGEPGITEREYGLSLPPGNGALTNAAATRLPADPPCFGVRPDLVDDFGVALQAHFGTLQDPTAVATTPLSNDDERGAVRWLLNQRLTTQSSAPPGPALDLSLTYGATNGPSAWDTTRVGLVDVSNGHNTGHQQTLILGDTADDFALALIVDRLYNSGTWIPHRWWQEGTGPHADIVLDELHGAISLARPHGVGAWIVASASLDEDAVADFRDAIVQQPSRFWTKSEQLSVSHKSIAVAGLDAALTYPPTGKHHLGIDRQFTSRTSFPVIRDASGSVTLASTPAPPLILHERLIGVPDLSWQVDIDIPDTPIPPSRTVPTTTLLHPDEQQMTTWLRSSRDGLSYEALSYGLVPAGAAPEDRVVRPRVRKPSLGAWAHARASLQGLSVETSAAGRHAELLQTLLGSRSALIRVFCGDLRPVFAEFLTNGQTTRDRYPHGEGCVIKNRTGYLHLTGIADFAGIPLAAAREQCDDLLKHRVLTRGLILACEVCTDLAFVTVDRLGQINECLRCGQGNEFVQQRWHLPNDEPRWFYDLHPAATALTQENGDVPLLLAHYLKSKSRQPRTYTDTAEFVLKSGAKAIAEADLLALIDGKLIVAETKCADDLDSNGDRRAAANKRVILSAAFDCDEIILATTQNRWNNASINAMSYAVGNHEWSRQPPRIRRIESLGSGDVTDEYL